MGFASTDSTNRESVGRISGCWTSSYGGSELRQFMDVSILRILLSSGVLEWIPCGHRGTIYLLSGEYLLSHTRAHTQRPPHWEIPRFLESCLKITALTDVQSILSSCFPFYQWAHYSFRGVRMGSLSCGGGWGIESVRKAKPQRRAWA